ncbi:MAG: alkaline phosphatase family protein [Elioraea sp.]|nr:alkaline phosphatase family protein [Elioraea sp.]
MMRVVLVALDGLRPDLVGPGLTPNLARLAEQGTRFVNATSVFPSETRVATPSLVTGCRPERHGMVANTIYDRGANRLVRTKTPEELASLAAGSVSPIEAETVGELLARRGRSFALVSSGSAGAARLLHPQAERLGQFRWSPDDPGCRGPGLEARFGPPPPPALPNLGRIAHAGRVFVEHVLAELEPDVALLWLSEPDFSFHYAGLGSPVAREALRAADAELGRVMAWRDGQPDRERIVLVAFSDHGHVTGTRRVSVVQALNAAGFRAGEDGESDIVVAGGGAVGLWLRDQAALPSVAEFLAAQPWVGVLLALAPDRLPAGLALPLSLTGSAHRRSPDLVCTFAGSDAPDPWGLSGTAAFDSADVPESGGMHGGLHRTELGTVLVMAGGPVRRGARVREPCDLCDIMPTVLHLLGLSGPGMDGKPLLAALDATEERGASAERFSLARGYALDGLRDSRGRFYPRAARPAERG